MRAMRAFLIASFEALRAVAEKNPGGPGGMTEFLLSHVGRTRLHVHNSCTNT